MDKGTPPTNPTKAMYSSRPNQFLSNQKEKGQGWQIECKAAKSWHLQLTSLLLSSKKENWYHKRKLLSRLILIFWHSRWFYSIFYLLIYRRLYFILLKLICWNSQLLSVTWSNLGYESEDYDKENIPLGTYGYGVFNIVQRNEFA